MPKRSAGLLMFRRREAAPAEVLLVHPGGPFWARKDLGAWTVPKGEIEPSEGALDAAKREFSEETGFAIREPLVDLGTLQQPSGKQVSVWAFESDCDPSALASSTVEIEWPPRSGLRASFPEVDRAGWFTLDEARAKIHAGQAGFIDALERLLGS